MDAETVARSQRAFHVSLNFKDAIFHFTGPVFRREIRRFAREHRREILLIFRNRDYDTAEFASLVSFLRLTLPWFANSNGPKKHVLCSEIPIASVFPLDADVRAGRLAGVAQPDC